MYLVTDFNFVVNKYWEFRNQLVREKSLNYFVNWGFQVSSCLQPVWLLLLLMWKYFQFWGSWPCHAPSLQTPHIRKCECKNQERLSNCVLLVPAKNLANVDVSFTITPPTFKRFEDSNLDLSLFIGQDTFYLKTVNLISTSDGPSSDFCDLALG